MLLLKLATQNLDTARAAWLEHPTALTRLAYDQAVHALVVAECRLNSSIRTDIVKAA